jgi:hypothetical protein
LDTDRLDYHKSQSSLRLHGQRRGRAGERPGFSGRDGTWEELNDNVALMQNLEDLLQRKVDVVSERALQWYIRDRVLAEATPL